MLLWMLVFFIHISASLWQTDEPPPRCHLPVLWNLQRLALTPSVVLKNNNKKKNNHFVDEYICKVVLAVLFRMGFVSAQPHNASLLKTSYLSCFGRGAAEGEHFSMYPVQPGLHCQHFPCWQRKHQHVAATVIAIYVGSEWNDAAHLCHKLQLL